MSRHWPLFDLRVRTPRLVLRPFTDADLDELADLALRGIHDPATMPFGHPWTDLPPVELARSVLQFSWRRRAELSPEIWSLGMGVWEGDTLVGHQDLFAKEFPVLRTVETGSWLGRDHQRQGIGTEMRAAVLHLAFTGLGATRATTEAFDDNAASLGVTRALGYRPNGDRPHQRRGEAVRLLRFTLGADEWAAGRRDDIAVEGLDACLPLLGLE